MTLTHYYTTNYKSAGRGECLESATFGRIQFRSYMGSPRLIPYTIVSFKYYPRLRVNITPVVDPWNH